VAISRSAAGRARIASAFGLCAPLETAEAAYDLLAYAQAPWFEMAEGDYPFPSDYITFAVGPGAYPLPAWPVRVACNHVGRDFGLSLRGNTSAVRFTAAVGNVSVDVDWASVTGGPFTDEQLTRSGVLDLVAGLGRGVGVWYNVSGTMKCHNLTAATTSNQADPTPPFLVADDGVPESSFIVDAYAPDDVGDVCTGSNEGWSRAGGWGPLCCNEGLRLVNTLATGVGRDFYWPPSPDSRDWNATAIVAAPIGACGQGYASEGLYGLPTGEGDPWSRWEDDYYGGLRLGGASNIVFSNGALDPWSAAGVIRGSPNRSLIPLLLDEGAHHLDLMFSTPADPPCAAEARAVEEAAIRQWIVGEPALRW